MAPTQLQPPPLHSSLSLQPDLREMVERFVNEMPERVERMQASFDRGDWAALRRTAHQIRAVAASYGFQVLVPFAARLERTLSGRPDREKIREALAELVAQCARVSTL